MLLNEAMQKASTLRDASNNRIATRVFRDSGITILVDAQGRSSFPTGGTLGDSANAVDWRVEPQ